MVSPGLAAHPRWMNRVVPGGVQHPREERTRGTDFLMKAGPKGDRFGASGGVCMGWLSQT